LTEPANRNLSLLEMFAQLALFSRNDIYTLQAIVLLMAWADKLMNVEFWNSCCDLYRHLLPELIGAKIYSSLGQKNCQGFRSYFLSIIWSN